MIPGRTEFGQADLEFEHALPKVYLDAAEGTSYSQGGQTPETFYVIDPEPRIVRVIGSPLRDAGLLDGDGHGQSHGGGGGGEGLRKA